MNEYQIRNCLQIITAFSIVKWCCSPVRIKGCLLWTLSYINQTSTAWRKGTERQSQKKTFITVVTVHKSIKSETNAICSLSIYKTYFTFNLNKNNLNVWLCWWYWGKQISDFGRYLENGWTLSCWLLRYPVPMFQG